MSGIDLELWRDDRRLFATADDDQHFVFNVAFVNSTPLAMWGGFNVICSALMIILITYMYRMNQLRWSIYIELVSCFAIVQFICDLIFHITSFRNVFWTPFGARAILLTWFFFGSMCASFSFTIVGTVLFVVEKARIPTKLFRNIVLSMNVLVGIITVSVCWDNTASSDSKKYLPKAMAMQGYIRDGIIVSAFILLLIMLFRIWAKSVKGKSRKNDPLFQLFRRLVGYPVIQMLSRSGTLYTTVIMNGSKTPTAEQLLFAAQLEAITGPLAGMGGLVAFLLMQTGAWKNFKRIMLCGFGNQDPMPSVHERMKKHASLRESRALSISIRRSSAKNISAATEMPEERPSMVPSNFSSFRDIDSDYSYEEYQEDEPNLDEYDEVDLSLEHEFRASTFEDTRRSINNPIQQSKSIEMTGGRI